MNKQLHAGHLKNLAVATALVNVTGGEAVAMLGASLGFKAGALEQYKAWCELAGYQPTLYFDTELPSPPQDLVDGEGEYVGCKLYNGVVIYKSTGAPTYAAHDLSFAATVSPDYYLTGAEQAPHFASLGLGSKHLPLGLVLGHDGKKMKSTLKKEGEEANMMSAVELFDSVKTCLSETPEPEKLAWNILAWQFNSSQVAATTKFNLAQWAKPESPGLYITYTHAKIKSALSKATAVPDETQLSQTDAELLGTASYYSYYLGKSQQQMQPAFIAQFAMTLAKKLASFYSKHTIKDASSGTVYAVAHANATLCECMTKLGMHPLEKV